MTDETHGSLPSGAPAAPSTAPSDPYGNGRGAGVAERPGGDEAGGAPGRDGGPGAVDGTTGGARGARRPERSTRRTVIEWLVLIAGALLIALLIKTFLFQAFYIPSESMVPTLKVGDRVLVNKLSYRLHDVNRGDLVVFKAPPGTETAQIRDLVKRVVGLPGETVEGRGGRIYIDGRRLAEPYLPAGVMSKDFGPEKVPDGRYFVLGDNRQFSKDSTYFHSIKRSEIVGRVFVRIWPLGRLGFL